MPLVDNQDGADAINAAISREARVWLYDPPKDGKTPLDGAGEPQRSRIKVADIPAKIALGFTREPVGYEPEPEDEPEDAPKKVSKPRAKK